ncbi:MAG: hypothetical protein ACK53D_02155 [Pseudanabaena sp.]
MDEFFAHYLKSLELIDLFMHLIIRRAFRYHDDWVGWCDEVLEAIAQTVKAKKL